LRAVSLPLAAAALGMFMFLLPSVASSAANVKRLYNDDCAGCHGMTGNGDGPAAMGLNPKPKPFRETLKDKSDVWIAKAIKRGGPSVGESPVMPPHPNMTDLQIHEIVEYIKKL
jgi:mono/diheme cytochrome c family protein